MRTVWIDTESGIWGELTGKLVKVRLTEAQFNLLCSEALSDREIIAVGENMGEAVT